MSLSSRTFCSMLTALLALTACAQEQNIISVNKPINSSAANISLVGQEWRVEDLANKGVIDNSLITLNFDADGRLHGNASCNMYGADYTVQGKNIKFGMMMSTERACIAPALMNQESQFFEILGKVTRFEFSETNALVLSTADGKTITARH